MSCICDSSQDTNGLRGVCSYERGSAVQRCCGNTVGRWYAANQRYTAPERMMASQLTYSEEDVKTLFSAYEDGQMEPGSQTRRMLQSVLKQLDRLVTEEKERQVWRRELFHLFRFERNRHVTRYSAPEFVCPSEMWREAMVMLDSIFPEGHVAESRVREIVNPPQPN